MTSTLITNGRRTRYQRSGHRPPRLRSGTTPRLPLGDREFTGSRAEAKPQSRDAHALGILHNAAVLVQDGLITWVGLAADAPAADEVVDLAGHALIPGFVDSHTHLVFGGDRVDEFEARMRGEKYAAAASVRPLPPPAPPATKNSAPGWPASSLNCAPKVPPRSRSKAATAWMLPPRARLVRLAREVTDEVTFLGAHVVPAEYAGQADDYVDLVVGEMLDACAPAARWIDVFCETGAFTPEQSRRVLEAGSRARPRRARACQPARRGPGACSWRLS